MNKFNINTYGIFSLKNKTKDFYQMLLAGLIIYILFLLVFKFTVKSEGYFLFLAIFISLLYIFASIVIPISLKIRLNKVVREVKIGEDQVVLVLKKEITWPIKDIKFEEVKKRFTGFSKSRKDGILVKTKTGKEYWIIEDFFNDYEELKKVLKVSNI